jgi:ribosome biogenesis protein Nip4
MRLVGLVAHMGEMGNAYRNMVGKPERKKLLQRPRHRWEDNIRMDLRETGREVVDWIHLAQVREQWQALVNTVMNFMFCKRQGIS